MTDYGIFWESFGETIDFVFNPRIMGGYFAGLIVMFGFAMVLFLIVLSILYILDNRK